MGKMIALVLGFFAILFVAAALALVVGLIVRGALSVWRRNLDDRRSSDEQVEDKH